MGIPKMIHARDCLCAKCLQEFAIANPVTDSPVETVRGDPCEVQVEGEWKPARFIATDLIGGEPIVQVDKSMPIFATWGSVRGVNRHAAADQPVAAPAVPPDAKVDELPLGYFSQNGGTAYGEVDPKYKDEADVIPLYRRPDSQSVFDALEQAAQACFARANTYADIKGKMQKVDNSYAGANMRLNEATACGKTILALIQSLKNGGGNG